MRVFSISLLTLAASPAALAFSPKAMDRSVSSELRSAAIEGDVVIEHSHCREPGDRDILIRAARGEVTERTPVWLCRQAGRYMAAFRAYSTKYGFRNRSETPDMAIELSLQCHRAYGMDGIIMFSDILTPLPTLGIDFDVVPGVGPVISTEIQSEEDVLALGDAESVDFDEKLPFIREILSTLSKEAEEANTALIGFVGAPFTLASYTIEGKSSKHCLTTKKLMMADELGDDKTMSMFLDKLAVMIGNYACHQIECGAQVIQLFESWAHQVSPSSFEKFAKPAAQKAIKIIKEKHPDTPVIYFANGGTSYLELQRDIGADMIAIDWHIDIAEARKILGPDVPISGNIDPTILFGSKEQIEQAVRDCIDKAGGPGNKHLLNLGHGVMQGTPEEAVGWLVDECKRYTGKQE
jgi:uroporphyrinogen decarboxylase